MLLWDWPISPKELVLAARDASAALLRHDASLQLVVLDHVQLVQHEASAKSREEGVAATARALKSIALDLKCHVLALSQLNRGVEQREDKKPLLSDLRESGALEEAADVVVGIYRPRYYNPKAEEGALAGILKNRNGPTGACKLGFTAKTIRFSDVEQGSETE